jgi:hypothetical protein
MIGGHEADEITQDIENETLRTGATAKRKLL